MSDEEYVVVNNTDTSVVVTPQDQIVTSVVQEQNVVATEKVATVAVATPEVYVVAQGQQGPPGAPGAGGGGEVFALDITPTATGIVSGKTYADADNIELADCVSDTTHLRVHVGVEGGSDKYKPDVLVNGVPAILSESSTIRWFTGYADIVVQAGINVINVVSDSGGTDTVQVEVLGAGPEILDIVFGAYPGTQTELKAGDVISVTITTQQEATEVSILAAGAAQATALPVTDGVATGPITISGAAGQQSIVAKARNAFGTFGQEFTSDPLTLNQTYPTLGVISVSYDNGLQAMGSGDTAQVSCTITNADIVTYSSAYMTIANDMMYEPTKSVLNLYSGYFGSGTNYQITATRAANNATTQNSAQVRIATVPPTAAITQSPVGRMVSSPTGIGYDIRVTPDQLVSTPPALTASHGAWSGDWINAGGYWHRTLVIADSVARGVGSFTGLSLVGPSGIAGTGITSGSSYVVGGFTSRTVTFPAFSRVAALGVNVSDQTKTTAQIAGGAVLTRYGDNGVYTNGYYIANADGSYNATGDHIGLSDSVFAGSNTSGTLQAIVQEVA